MHNNLLWETVKKICNETGGGRAMQQTDGIICILDCPRWNRRSDAMLHLECPSATVCVESSIASLSGFMLVIQMRQIPNRPSFLSSLYLSIVIILAVIVVSIGVLFTATVIFIPPLSTNYSDISSDSKIINMTYFEFQKTVKSQWETTIELLRPFFSSNACFWTRGTTNNQTLW